MFLVGLYQGNKKKVSDPHNNPFIVDDVIAVTEAGINAQKMNVFIRNSSQSEAYLMGT